MGWDSAPLAFKHRWKVITPKTGAKDGGRKEKESNGLPYLLTLKGPGGLVCLFVCLCYYNPNLVRGSSLILYRLILRRKTPHLPN